LVGFLSIKFWGSVPLKSIEENNFILNNQIYFGAFANSQNKSVRIRGIHTVKRYGLVNFSEMKLCAFTEYTK
jgi:hypothetical protein